MVRLERPFHRSSTVLLCAHPGCNKAVDDRVFVLRHKRKLAFLDMVLDPDAGDYSFVQVGDEASAYRFNSDHFMSHADELTCLVGRKRRAELLKDYAVFYLDDERNGDCDKHTQRISRAEYRELKKELSA